MNWFYSLNGEQVGPVSAEEIKAKVASGQVSDSSLVWREGMADWVAFSTVAELQGGSAVDASPAVTPTSAPAAAVSPYQPPQAVGSPTASGTLAPGEKIPTYLWQSIVATLFCCLPFGVVGIVFAAKVNNLLVGGQIDAAREASKNAKKWTNISVIVTLVLVLISFLVGLLDEG